MPLILGWGYILEICQAVVPTVTIQVIHLPTARTWGRAQKGCSHQTMHLVILVPNCRNPVPAAVRTPIVNSAGGSRNTSVRAHLPTDRSISYAQSTATEKLERPTGKGRLPQKPCAANHA